MMKIEMKLQYVFEENSRLTSGFCCGEVKLVKLTRTKKQIRQSFINDRLGLKRHLYKQVQYAKICLALYNDVSIHNFDLCIFRTDR